MKYFSEVTEKVYDSIEDLNKAEAEVKAQEEAKKKANEKRAVRAKEVEDAIKVAHEAQKAADELMAAFVNDYGSFHYTFKDNGKKHSDFDFLFDWLL